MNNNNNYKEKNKKTHRIKKKQRKKSYASAICKYILLVPLLNSRVHKEVSFQSFNLKTFALDAAS